MGRVVVEATIENLADAFNASRGVIGDEAVRAVTVSDALVDTGATIVSLPPDVIEKLGLEPVQTRRMRTAGGMVEATMFSAVRLTIAGRACTVDVMEVPAGIPVLIGQVPLEILDFVVDPGKRELIPNPRNGGEWIYECYPAGPAGA